LLVLKYLVSFVVSGAYLNDGKNIVVTEPLILLFIDEDER